MSVARVTSGEADTMHIELSQTAASESTRTLSEAAAVALLNRMKDLQSASYLAESIAHLTSPLFIDSQIQVQPQVLEAKSRRTWHG